MIHNILFQFTPLREGLREKIWRRDRKNPFQFTPLREGLPRDAAQSIKLIYFNSRPCERGFIAPRKDLEADRFQFTPLREGLPSLVNLSLSVNVFQFTPLREGLQYTYRILSHQDSYFNSRPCERGFGLLPDHPEYVSHFNSRPCERGFSIFFNFPALFSISIHAPARGASSSRWRRIRNGLYFNSRPCERGFSKNRQFFYRSFAVFYPINTFSQN